MTTSDMFGGTTAPPPAAGGRLLRRNRTNRVAAGVSSGLGEYFGVDPVLFRVLFATAAFFGGAGILAYLLAWAAIPETGTAHAPIDSFIAWVRRRRVPVWIVALVAGLFIWAVAFSWWSPGPFIPVIAVVVLLVVLFTRREMQATAPQPAAPPPLAPMPAVPTPPGPVASTATVDLTKDGDTSPPAPPSEGQATWMRDARSWFDEAREASRIRRQRSMPLRIAMIVSLAVTLTVLGIADAVTGIQFQTYFWVTLGIVGVGLLVGMIARRTPWSMLPLLVLGAAGAIAFAGSAASLHDGVGQRDWHPTVTPASDYRLAFGQGTLDLRDLPQQTGPQNIDITMGAGQVKILANPDQNVTVQADLRFGQVTSDGAEVDSTEGGVGISKTVDPPATEHGAPVFVHVRLADGDVTVDHNG
jgi:phage shock protein PspC (stress-responsive transcriptional regulator)/FtsH-binding integral membrane protein